jgi:hypothetical protein
MHALPRVASLAAVAVRVALLAACPPAATDCVFDADCAANHQCQSGTCVERPGLTCDVGDPCEDDRGCPGGYCDLAADAELGCCIAIDLCIADRDCAPGCWCVVPSGQCDCESELCDPIDQAGCPNGALCSYTDGEPRCLENAPAAASCEVIAGGRVIGGSGPAHPAITASNVPLRLRALARDEQGRLAPHASFSFSGAGVLTDGLFQATCTGPDPCLFEVGATTSGAACAGSVRVFPPLAEGTSRVLVIDVDTGAPLVDVPVAFGLDAALEMTTTDSLGRAESLMDGAPWTSLSAFPTTHEWQTVLGAPNDAVLYTRALPAPDRVAGLKGTFDFTALSTLGDIKLGLAGLALRGGPTALTAYALVGPATPTAIDAEGITAPGGQTLGLPAASVLEIGNERTKEGFVALGAPGGRIAWALAGKLRLSEVGPRALELLEATQSERGSALLRMLAPALARFDHDVVTELAPRALVDRPADDPAGTPAPFASWPLDEHEFRPDTLLSRTARYTLPVLPCAAGTSPNCTPPPGAGPDASPFHEGALLLSGALVPADGFVPLGLGAAFDVVDPGPAAGDERDGIARMDNEDGSLPSEALFDHAPAHDGLEGHPMLHVAIAFEEGFDPFADPWQQRTSAVVARQTTSATDVASFESAFLPVPQASHSAENGVFVVEAQPDADFSRLVLDDGAGGAWHVWFATDAEPIDLASVAPVDVMFEERAVRARIESFKVGASAVTEGSASFASLVALGDDEMGELFHIVTAWSGAPCADP